ncbi:MAG: hypothetical protein ABFR19_04220 [Pseudomonadota bacterium]
MKSPAAFAAVSLLLLTTTAHAEGFKIIKFYESSSSDLHVVTESETTVQAKCTLFNEAGDVMSVNRVRINSGHNELPIHTNEPASTVYRVLCSIHSDQL